METKGNARGRLTRAHLLTAGWEVLDHLRVDQIFDAVPARTVAEHAGESERALRHHYPTGDEFGAALLDLPLPTGFFGDGLDYGSVQALTDILSELDPAETVDAVRAAAEANWREVTQPDSARSVRRQLFLLSRLEAHPELADRLRDEYYGRYLPLFGAAYRAAIDRAGRSLLEPFTLDEFTATLAALSEGFLLQWMADPERITADLVSRVSVAVALSFTVAPDDPRHSLDDLEGTAVAAPERVTPGDERIAARCLELFRTGLDHVSWSGAATQCGLSVVDLRSRFPSMRALAAAAFSAHLPAIERSGSSNQDRDPRRALPDTLCELVRCVRHDPWCAQALLTERHCAANSGEPWVFEIVPVDAAVLSGAQMLSPSAARRVVDTTLTLAATEPTASPASIAGWAAGVGSDTPAGC